MLTRSAGLPGGLTQAERARPATGAAGSADGTGPGARALEASDADVIGQSLGDPSRFGMIFERHADEILRYAHARLGPDLAEEVLAETFLAAFGRRGQYDCSRPRRSAAAVPGPGATAPTARRPGTAATAPP